MQISSRDFRIFLRTKLIIFHGTPANVRKRKISSKFFLLL